MVTTIGVTLAALPPGCSRLVRLMQRVNFGRIQFTVRAGQPDFTRPVRTVRTVKPAGDRNGTRREARRVDFELRKEVTMLLDHAAQAPDGAQVTVKVEHGLPVLIEIEQEHTA